MERSWWRALYPNLSLTVRAPSCPAASGGAVVGLDPLSGNVRWTYSGWQCGIPVPHAVDAGEGRALITGGYRAGSAMIKVERKADGNAKVYLVERSPTAFKPLTIADLLEPGENWAPLALADGKLLIRDQKNLKCLAVGQQGR